MMKPTRGSIRVDRTSVTAEFSGRLVPRRSDGPGKRVPRGSPAGSLAARAARQARRDLRLRRAGAVHRRPGEVLLVGHGAPARVRDRGASRARSAAHRRSVRGGRHRLPRPLPRAHAGVQGRGDDDGARLTRALPGGATLRHRAAAGPWPGDCRWTAGGGVRRLRTGHRGRGRERSGRTRGASRPAPRSTSNRVEVLGGEGATEPLFQPDAGLDAPHSPAGTPGHRRRVGRGPDRARMARAARHEVQPSGHRDHGARPASG